MSVYIQLESCDLPCLHSSLLEDIWNATVDALSKSVSTLPKKPNQKYLYQRLHDSLDFLHGFFNAGGEGLTGEQLETEQYKVGTPNATWVHCYEK